MRQHNAMRIKRGLMLVMMLSMTACTDLMLRDDLVKYEEGQRNPEQEISQVEITRQQVFELIKEADTALANQQFALANEKYKAVLDLDATNLRAQEGLKRVVSQQEHQGWLTDAQSLAQQGEDGREQAKALLTNILSENPNNLQATELYRAILADEEAARLEAMKVKLEYDAPVTLEFRDTEIKVIIEALAKATGINFTLDKDVKSNSKASIFARNVSLEDALNMLVDSNQLRMKVVTKDTVLIYPDKALKVRQYEDQIIRSFYLEYAEPESMAALLRSMLGIKQIQTDQRLPMILIKDVPEVMALVEKLIASQDVPEPEVMLEMDIIEVNRSTDITAGFRWPTQLSVLSSDTLTLEALQATDSSTVGISPNPAINFDGGDSQVNLIANPRIRVKNGDSAKIHIGDRLPIITSNVSSNGVTSENVQYIDVGLKLDAEPTINLGGDVNIKLNLEVSSISDTITTNSGAVVYQIGNRSTSTQLRLKDGETQVLAGLINDQDRRNVSKIPGLGDLPGIGKLFSNKTDSKSKTELVLLITPHIVRQYSAPDAALSEYWVGSELQAGRAFTQPRTQKDISKLFRVGTPNGAAPAPAPEPESQAPAGLNIPLPSGLIPGNQ